MRVDDFVNIINNYAEENQYDHPVARTDKVDDQGNELVIFKFNKTILYSDTKQKDESLLKRAAKIFEFSSNVDFDTEVKPGHIENMKYSFDRMMPGVVQEVRIQKEKTQNPLVGKYKTSKQVRGNLLGTQEASVRVRILKSTIEKMDEAAAKRFAIAMDVAAALTDIDPDNKVTAEKSRFRKLYDSKKLWGYNLANMVIKHPEVSSGNLASAANGVGVGVATVAVTLGTIAVAVFAAKAGGKYLDNTFDEVHEGNYFSGMLNFHMANHCYDLAGDVIVGGGRAVGGIVSQVGKNDGTGDDVTVYASGDSSGLATKSKITYKTPKTEL